MPCSAEPVLLSYLVFQLLNLRGKKFNGGPAVGANHMVMVATIVLMLVSGDAVVECDFAGQTAFS
jgi:hypothetical protein